MRNGVVLDVLETLLRISAHPDIAEVYRYGQGNALSPDGIGIRYRSGAEGYLWIASGVAQPQPLPGVLTSYRHRAQHLVKLVADLLEVAEPFAAWETVGYAGTALKPCGLRVTTRDGDTVALRVTSAGAPVPEGDEVAFPDYVVPMDVKAWETTPGR
ncbi:hypothetical protein [Actinoplanes sp. NPDC051494]|uniref:hypothetical protein n=1 Tax=Actinoplanes sp. NPDC051494 TaxID=3363907 RepID=UPI0037B14A05